jgi:hypothetical protein
MLIFDNLELFNWHDEWPREFYSLNILVFENQFKLISTKEKLLQNIICFIIKYSAKVWFTAINIIKIHINDKMFIKI